MDEDYKIKFLTEMSKVAEAVHNAFNPDKLNYGLLSNGDTHIHWHIFPRWECDTPVKGPVWWLDRELMYSDDIKSNEHELTEMKIKLYNELEKLVKVSSKGNF